MKQKLLILLTLLTFCTAVSSAQRNYPVRATVQYTPPYSLFLGDYATPKLIITLTGQDLLDANCPYKLSFSLECQNVKVTTKPSFNPAPLYINGGQTIVLTGADLARYFDIQNLDFHGITAAKYLQDGQLPEGFYRMNVKVIHYHENRVISNTAFTMFNARMGKPPVLSLPKNKTLIPPAQQQSPIVFTWIPKTVGAFNYKFELWECAVPGIPVQTVVSTVRPIYSQTYTTSQISFQPATVNMKPGMEYAWRVTVEDPHNQQKFANQGQSEIFTFTYKRKPEPVTGLRFSNRGLKITWTWDMDPAHTKYYFEYYDPQTGRTIDPVACDYAEFVRNMPQTGYHLKARVKAECYGDPTLMSDYTPYLDTYLEPIPVPEYECGKQFPDREITNLELKHTFAPGEIVESKNGDTRYEIIFSEEKNGYLSGQFYMIMDCWGGAKIKCEFSKTQINTDNIVLNTIFHNVPDSTLYVKPETIRKEIQEAFFDAATVLTDFSIKDTVKIDKPYTYLYINESGKVMAVFDDKGKIKTEETTISATNLKENTLVQGPNNEELVITKKGQVMGKEEFNATGGNGILLKEYHRKSDSLAQWQINFSKYDGQTYAFDHIASGDHGIFSSAEYYPQSGSYDFRYKSVECGKTDKVKVEFDTYPQADSVVFKDKYGVTYPIKDNIISFTGVSKADTNFIYAYRGDQKIGKLFLNTYQKKTYKVVFVRVNGAAKKLNAKEITKYLNKVYNQCAVSFEDSIDNITIDDLTSFSHGGSGILTVYNDDQKRVLQAYEKEKKMKDGVFYLFFIDNVTDKKDGSGTPVSGYMPRGYNCGFIYDGGSERTIAHELGHGIAGLEHVFENSSNSGKTQNLMDYASGEELWHFQWDQIQDPSRVWMKWNKAEEEGENLEEQDLRNLFRYTIPDYPVSGIFIAPSEWPIWIDDVMTAFVLVPSGYGISLSNRQRPDAAIYGFITTDNETFMAKFSESGHFEGFYNTDGDALYVDKDNVTLTNYHRTGSPVYYWDIQSRSFYNNLYVAPNEPVGDEWTPYYYSAVIPDYMEEARQRNLEKLLKKKADGQSQYWFYDVKNNKIVVILGYTGGRVLRRNNVKSIITLDELEKKNAEIKKFESMAAFAGSEYNWLANDVRSTMNEAGEYVIAGLTITAAAPYLLEAALVGEGVSGKFAEGFLSDFVSNSVANMVTYFIVEHWLNDKPKKGWNEYFDLKEMILDASIAGAKNLYAPASFEYKLLYDAAVDGIQAVNVRELLDNETTFLDQVVNFSIGAGVAVIVDAITPKLTQKLAKHSFTKTLDFVQLRRAVTSTTFAKNEKFVSVINQLLAGVAVPKVFKFSANIDEKQLRTVVGNLLNTDQGALSLNLIRRSSKEFTSVEEFERLADNLVSSFANVNISNCSDIINDISPKIIDGIVDLSLSPYHYATTDVFLNKLFMSKLSNKTDILNVCFTHQHSALLVGDLCRRIDEYDIGDLVKRISSVDSYVNIYSTLSQQLTRRYGSSEQSGKLLFDFLFSHHFDANEIDEYMSGNNQMIDEIIKMLTSSGGVELMDLLKEASVRIDKDILSVCTTFYSYFEKGIQSKDYNYLKIILNKYNNPMSRIKDIKEVYKVFSPSDVTGHLKLLADEQISSVHIGSNKANISYASVAMSDTGPFRASLPGQYQRNKITHVLLKTDDNKPAYVKVIENVTDNQSCAVVVTPKDEKEWVMFQLALWSVGGDVTKNSELRKRVVQHIQDYFLEDSEATNQ